MRDSGQSAPSQVISRRQNTREPGAELGELPEFRLGVERVQAHALLERPGDIALLLDGVAVRDAVGGGAGSQHHLDLAAAGGIEGRAEPGEQFEDLRCRIGLHRVVHVGNRQIAAQRAIVVGNHVEIDHQQGGVGTSLGEVTVDLGGHRNSPRARIGARHTLVRSGRSGIEPRGSEGSEAEAELQRDLDGCSRSVVVGDGTLPWPRTLRKGGS